MKHYFLGTNAGVSKKERIWRRKAQANREDYDKLRDFLKEHFGASQVLLTRNGRSSIAAGLTYGIAEKGEVIINGFTCHAVVQGVKAAGMTPVYADISPKTLNFTPESLAAVVSKNTRAVIVQNTLGNMVDIKEIEAFCKKHNLILVEDLAHCQGRKYPDGRETGTVGEIVALSFGKEKVFDAGEGGALILRGKMPKIPEPTEEPPYQEEFRARIYPTIGQIYRALSYVGCRGLFMRLMLKIGWVKKSADAEVDFKNKHLSFFQAKLAYEKMAGGLKIDSRGVLREFYLVNDREKLLDELKKSGYYFGGFWYEKPVSPERYYKKAHFPEEKCKNATFVAERIINLPTYYSEKDLAPARKIIKKYLIKEGNE
jgi:dTDP-4-amino-4,6-dideoxygalactose transaminase